MGFKSNPEVFQGFHERSRSVPRSLRVFQRCSMGFWQIKAFPVVFQIISGVFKVVSGVLQRIWFQWISWTFQGSSKKFQSRSMELYGVSEAF